MGGAVTSIKTGKTCKAVRAGSKFIIMLKTILKILLSAIVYIVAFILINAVLPYSQGFRELGASEDPAGMLFLLITSVWVCFTVYYIVRHSHFSGIKLFLNILFVLFFVQCFMMQIETLFFGYAFQVLTKGDVVFIMLAGLFPLLATIPLLMTFFQNKHVSVESEKVEKINMRSIALKLGIIGVMYLFVYMMFGYYVAWQFEELRIFYTGLAEKLSFWGQMLNNFKTNPGIFPFQIVRGVLFGIFIIPLTVMVNKKADFIISVCLVYLCTAVVLLIPNVLFPDVVRFAHFIEMTGSMLLFGIIVGYIMWRKDNMQIESCIDE